MTATKTEEKVKHKHATAYRNTFDLYSEHTLSVAGTNNTLREDDVDGVTTSSSSSGTQSSGTILHTDDDDDKNDACVHFGVRTRAHTNGPLQAHRRVLNALRRHVSQAVLTAPARPRPKIYLPHGYAAIFMAYAYAKSRV